MTANGLRQVVRLRPYRTIWAVPLLLVLLSAFLGKPKDGTFSALGEAVNSVGGLAIFAAPIVTIYVWVRRFRENRKAKKELLARCHYEHRAIMNGDPAGFYGRYTPAQLEEPY